MAIRERKGRKSPWQCYWNNPITGKRESVNFETKLDAEKYDSLVKHRIRFDRESFKKEDAGEKENVNTLASCYLLYLREKQFSKKGLRWQMEGMKMALQKFGNLPLHEIGHDKIAHLAEAMTSTNVKAVTVRKRMSVLKTVFRWSVRRGYCVMPEFPTLPTGRYEKFIPPSPEELQAIIAFAPEHVVRIVIIGSQFGVRVGPSELMGLTWNDIDFDQKIMRVHGSRKNLNAPWREVPIRESLVPVLMAWFHDDRGGATNHIIHYNGKPIQSAKKAWAATLRRAGITRRIRPYDLRHAFGTDMIAEGIDIGTVANLMGHSNPTMLLTHYQYVMDKQKRRAVESLPEIGYVPKSMCPKSQALTDLQ